jgi:Co/Zn/Cd efflux system component
MRMQRRMRGHLVSHWRVWVLIAVVVIVVNELVDRNFFDHREHIEGDFVLTVLALVVSFFGSYLFVRTRRRRRPAT